MISVIVPAHNEEAVIERGLRAMTAGAAPGEIQIIVACNGCTDRTAQMARRVNGPIVVLEIEPASKIAALNAGDARASGFPRFYVDADVAIDWRSLRAMAETLERGPALFANPRLKMNFASASWAVRAYYQVWTALPYNRTGGMVGTGVYAVSAAGRARWAAFPTLIADDAFVRFCFAPEERVRVDDAVSTVDAPHTLGSLIRIKTRSRLGLRQLKATLPERSISDRRDSGGLLKTLLGRPQLWAAAPIYLLVNLVTRLRARRQAAAGQLVWERDDSARVAPVELTPRPTESGPPNPARSA